MANYIRPSTSRPVSATPSNAPTEHFISHSHHDDSRFSTFSTPVLSANSSFVNLNLAEGHDSAGKKQQQQQTEKELLSPPQHEPHGIPEVPDTEHLSFAERMKHFTWAWYTSVMSTGGIAILFSICPRSFPGLHTIGSIMYILQILLFLGIGAGLTFRFCRYKGLFSQTVTHHAETMFVSTMFISCATIISNAKIYGAPHLGPWFNDALRVLFWLYASVTFTVSIFQYEHLFANRKLKIQNMTPGWLLPIFPSMMAGTIAINIAEDQSYENAMPIIVAGLSLQFLGFFFFIFMISIFLARLATFGFPPAVFRPGMFISVGPPSFTAFVTLELTKIAHDKLKTQDLESDWLPLFGLVASCAILILAFFMFTLTTVAVARDCRQLRFKLVWWTFVFPNVGFTIAVIKFADAIKSDWLQWIATVMVIIMTCLWLGVGIAHVIAVRRKQIMWPGRDEDAH